MCVGLRLHSNGAVRCVCLVSGYEKSVRCAIVIRTSAMPQASNQVMIVFDDQLIDFAEQLGGQQTEILNNLPEAILLVVKAIIRMPEKFPQQRMMMGIILDSVIIHVEDLFDQTKNKYWPKIHPLPPNRSVDLLQRDSDRTMRTVRHKNRQCHITLAARLRILSCHLEIVAEFGSEQ